MNKSPIQLDKENNTIETPMWKDEEDENIKINLNKKNNLKKLKKNNEDNVITGSEFQERLREQFNKVNDKVDIFKWAFEKDEDLKQNSTNDQYSNDGISSLLKTNKTIIDPHAQTKDTSILSIKQFTDFNKDNIHSSIITSVGFSPDPNKETLGFTAGLDKKLKFFSINEAENKSFHIQTVNTVDLPIHSARFLNNNEVLISGKRQHFYTYNLEHNKLDRCNGLFSNHTEIKSLEKLFVGNNQFAFGCSDGHILIYDSNNKTYRYDLKISGSVNSVCFDKNGINLFAVGEQSEIYLFDLRKYRNCVNKFSDSGNFNTTCMDLSKDNNFLATGSTSGMVNVYSTEDIFKNNDHIEPIKVYNYFNM